MAYLFLPVIGEFLIYLDGGYSVAPGKVDASLVAANLVFCIVLIFVAYIVAYSFQRDKIFRFGVKYEERTLNRIIVAMIFVAMFVFLIAGYKFLVLGVPRGQLRVGFGWYGFIYKWVVQYLTPALLCLAGYIYRFGSGAKGQGKKVASIFLLAVLVGVFTGYKSVVVTVTLPFGAIMASKGIDIKKLALALGFMIVALIFTTALVRGIAYSEAIAFLVYRLTTMTAYGAIAVWEYFPNGGGEDAFKLAYGVLGNNLASLLAGGAASDYGFLYHNISKLMTYLAYANHQGAVDGTTNITVTSFGEAVYMLGDFYLLYAIVSGLIVGGVLRLILSGLSGGRISSVMSLVFLFMVILPWFNSGGIFSLISIPVWIWMLSTQTMILLIVKGRW
jgi:hypothetical protein